MPGHLHKLVSKNFFALFLSQYGGMLCNSVFAILLARLLAPQDFGGIAMALFSLSCFNFVLEWGWEQAFMAIKDVDFHKAASTHFIIRSVLGAVPLCSFLIGAPLFKKLVSSTGYEVIIFLAGIYWLERITLTYKTILERCFKLHHVARIEFVASVLSYAVAVVAAWRGLGIYSLVLQRFVEKMMLLCGYGYYSPWKFGLSFDVAIVKTFLRTFGAATWLSGIIGLPMYDFMPFLIGILSSTAQAGLYEKAFNLATFPMMLTGIASRITIPLYTRYQFNQDQLRNIFVKAQALKSIILLPVQVLLMSGASYWIPALLGKQWEPLIPVYHVMTIYGLFRAFYDDVPPVLSYGFKNPWELTKNQAVQGIMIVIVGYGLVKGYAALGGAFTMSISMVFATVLFWRKVFGYVGCSWRDFKNFYRQLPRLWKKYVVIFR